ncbi:MAG: 2-oxo acid dehydrogenase subunit E2 [Anaerolineae bacterium]|nr:2-oxo acid dehydrogenase subunit E2 [Anaerolineae bacterium]
MDIEIKMPDLATTEDEVKILRWLIEVGKPVKLGQPLVEIETDKATMDVESVAAGTLRAVLVNEEEMAAVGQVIAIIESAAVSSPPTVLAAAAPEAAPVVVAAAAPVAKRAESMFARNQQARQAAKPDEIALNATEQELARRLQKSKQTIPHYYLTTSANAERMVELRAAAREQNPPQTLVWDAFFVVAIARALKDFPRMAYQFDEARLVSAATGAIGVAAEIDNALYVVAVDNPLSLTMEQVSQQITGKVARIRQADPASKKLVPTAITVTNLGAENIESFAAIINPGEAAILAIGKVTPTVQVVGGEIVIQQRVHMTLSVDHRVANGKYAAGFLSKIMTELESL